MGMGMGDLEGQEYVTFPQNFQFQYHLHFYVRLEWSRSRSGEMLICGIVNIPRVKTMKFAA